MLLCLFQVFAPPFTVKRERVWSGCRLPTGWTWTERLSEASVFSSVKGTITANTWRFVLKIKENAFHTFTTQFATRYACHAVWHLT